MKKLNFILKENNNVVIEKNVMYKVENNYIIFDFDNNMFKINITDNMHFLKETRDDIFEIIMENDVIKSMYTLKSINMTFDVKIIDFSYTFNDNVHVIKYNIESDSESLKEIILTLHK